VILGWQKVIASKTASKKDEKNDEFRAGNFALRRSGVIYSVAEK
jgi:hypothetical protein